MPVTTRSFLLVAGILLISMNLRAPFTSIAPLLGIIRRDLALSTAAAGALTTLPLLAFAALSPFGALVAREYGIERSLLGALVLIAGGIALRSLGAEWTLFLGTLILGCGIAVGNVLLPSLLKRDFPDKVVTLTGAYVLTAGMTAALASAVAVPLAQVPALGWQGALGALVVLPLAAIALWIPQSGSHAAPAKGTATPPHGGRMWRSALAWQVTLFLGLNSFVYYTVAGWLPTILADAGRSAADSGALHGVLQLATAVPGLVLGPIVGRMKDQRAIAFGVSVLVATGLLGFMLAPAWATLWIILFGLSAGATFILGTAFIGLRVANSHQAATLSGMAQCAGYLLASAGPTLIGALHDVLGGWNVPLTVCVALSLVMALLGLLAGRVRHVIEAARPA